MGDVADVWDTVWWVCSDDGLGATAGVGWLGVGLLFRQGSVVPIAEPFVSGWHPCRLCAAQLDDFPKVDSSERPRRAEAKQRAAHAPRGTWAIRRAGSVGLECDTPPAAEEDNARKLLTRPPCSCGTGRPCCTATRQLFTPSAPRYRTGTRSLPSAGGS